jgi:hypothetical protein
LFLKVSDQGCSLTSICHLLLAIKSQGCFLDFKDGPFFSVALMGHSGIPARRTRHENLVDPSTRDRGGRLRGDGVGATADVAAEAGGGHRHPRHPRQGPRPPLRPCHRRRLPPPRRHRESFLSLLLPLYENLLASLGLVASV